MDDAIDLVCANNAFEFVVVTDIGLDLRDIDVVLGAQVLGAVFEALI